MNFDPTKSVTTRDGRPARIICSDSRGTKPLVALLTDLNGCEHVKFLCIDGTYYGLGIELPWDLVNTPERIEREYWVNVYADYISYLYGTKAEADKNALLGRIACVPVKISCVAGEGLEKE